MKQITSPCGSWVIFTDTTKILFQFFAILNKVPQAATKPFLNSVMPQHSSYIIVGLPLFKSEKIDFPPLEFP